MNYFLTELSNGLRIVTIPFPDRDSAACGIWVKAGGRLEPKKLSGVSHLLEHMLFKGTRLRSTRQIKEEIEGVGGMLNAFTGEEATCYFAKIPKEHFPRALSVLSDMVNHATLNSGELKKERTVILEEIKMYRDLPSQHVHDMMGEMLWPNQPLGRPLAGTVESVSALSRKQILNYMKTHYHPSNFVVSLSGPLNHEEVVRDVESFFSRGKKRGESSFPKARIKQSKPAVCFLKKETEQTHFVIGFHSVSRFSPDRYKLGVLHVILGANMSSRLFEEVREKRGLAYEIRSGLNFFHDTGAVLISAGVEAKKAGQAIQVILRELVKLQKKRVSPQELRRAKDYFMGQLSLSLEDTLDHLLWVGERVLDHGSVPDKEEIRKSIEAVTPEDIQAIAKKLFVTRHLNLALIGPVPEKEQHRIKRDFKL